MPDVCSEKLIEKSFESNLQSAIRPGTLAERDESGLSGVTADQGWSLLSSAALLSNR